MIAWTVSVSGFCYHHRLYISSTWMPQWTRAARLLILLLHTWYLDSFLRPSRTWWRFKLRVLLCCPALLVCQARDHVIFLVVYRRSGLDSSSQSFWLLAWIWQPFYVPLSISFQEPDLVLLSPATGGRAINLMNNARAKIAGSYAPGS